MDRTIREVWVILFSFEVDTFSGNRHSYKSLTKLASFGRNFSNQLFINPESKGRSLGSGKYLRTLTSPGTEGTMPVPTESDMPRASWHIECLYTNWCICDLRLPRLTKRVR